ncbi:MAG: aminodeoxychorismate synthase component I [Acidimicrobiales bacterium]|nr:aminodeoxychorismate synthase component I [Acidimicrobiales bacterium]
MLRTAVLQQPLPQGRRWLRFDAPRAVHIAHCVADVPGVLAAVEAAAAQGRWCVGFVSYDAAPAFDPALVALRDPAVPLAVWAEFDGPTAVGDRPQLVAAPYRCGPWTPDSSRAEHAAALARIRAHLRDGDTYQVNHTFRLAADFDGDPAGLFHQLVDAQRADHGAYLDLGDAAICSASPELFVRRVGTDVTCRPMKGTAPRHPDPEWDAEVGSRLKRSPKDRAENVMIVDMVRNDLGRVARVGSVAVPALFELERYPTVHQLTSTVTASVDAPLSDLLRAVFPGASITGAPKVAASRIIAELETTPRGIYTGAIGALSPHGTLELNLAIRTAWVDRAAGRATYGVGGGIVWDSDPDDEWDEAIAKSRVLTERLPDFDLLETIRVDPPPGGAVLLDRHLDRLRASAEHLGFEVDLDEVRSHVVALTPDDAQRVRVLVSRRGEVRVESEPLTAPPPEPWPVPVAEGAVRSDDASCRHKTTHRGVYERARAAAPDAPDVILCNERGELTETTIGNLVLQLDDKLVTPPVSSGLLPGTFRAQLLDDAVVTERVLTIDDLVSARAAWMVNSVRGWVRIEPILPERREA